VRATLADSVVRLAGIPSRPFSSLSSSLALPVIPEWAFFCEVPQMADIADLAQDAIERELEAAVAAARGIPARYRLHCLECGDPLAEHRRAYGRCVECQADVEQWERLRGGGA
jgi:hypothetical protein